jgi:hypothetical protein
MKRLIILKWCTSSVFGILSIGLWRMSLPRSFIHNAPQITPRHITMCPDHQDKLLSELCDFNMIEYPKQIVFLASCLLVRTWVFLAIEGMLWCFMIFCKWWYRLLSCSLRISLFHFRYVNQVFVGGLRSGTPRVLNQRYPHHGFYMGILINTTEE